MSGHLYCHYIDKLPLDLPKQDLKDNNVLIWNIDTDNYLSHLTVLEKILTLEEKQRAARFYQKSDAEKFIIRRAILKIILSVFQNCPASQVELISGLHGKPQLAGNKGIHFNVSHAKSHAVIAVSARQIGVDLEFIQPDFDYTSVAEYSFSSQEIELLRQSSNTVKDFFCFWTRKEAFFKAKGTGLGNYTHLLNCLDGSQLIPAELAERKNWDIYTMELPHQYLLSIAAEQTPIRLDAAFINFNKDLLLKPS